MEGAITAYAGFGGALALDVALRAIFIEGFGLKPSDVAFLAGIIGRKGVNAFGISVIANAFLLGFATGYSYISFIRDVMFGD